MSNSNPKTYVCWNCNNEITESQMTKLFCPHCNSLQPPAQINHFQRLDVPVSYECGINSIDQAYYAIQTKLHPDRFIKKNEKDKQLSAQQTMSVNQSYKILKDPLKRSEYLLSLNNIIVNQDGKGLKPTQELLEESLNSRIELDEIEEINEVHQMASKYVDLRIKMINEISNGFKENKLDEVTHSTMRLRYLEKLIEEIKLKERKLKQKLDT